MNDLDPLSLLGEDYKGTYEGFLNDQFMESSATGIEVRYNGITLRYVTVCDRVQYLPIILFVLKDLEKGPIII